MYAREFIIQVSIQLMVRTQSFIKVSDDPFDKLVSYILSNYILEQAKYLDFDVLKYDPKEFTATLIKTRTGLLVELQK